jgi:RNA polymerase sigma-B factor
MPQPRPTSNSASPRQPSGTSLPQPSERDLFRRLRLAGDSSAREAIIERFLPLARQLARRYRGRTEPVEDLEQVASLALVKAVDRFDLARGTAFSSFLVPTVLGELKRHLRDCSWSAHVPRRVQERVMSVTQAMDRLASERGRSPTVSELAEATEYSSEEVVEAMEASHAYQARSIDGGGPDEKDGERADSMPELGRREPGYDVVELGASVRPTVRSLSDRDREILHLRFVEDLTQSRIAERMGISQMHVSRLIRAAVDRLEDAVDEDAVSDDLRVASSRG